MECSSACPVGRGCRRALAPVAPLLLLLSSGFRSTAAARRREFREALKARGRRLLISARLLIRARFSNCLARCCWRWRWATFGGNRCSGLSSVLGLRATRAHGASLTHALAVRAAHCPAFAATPASSAKSPSPSPPRPGRSAMDILAACTRDSSAGPHNRNQQSLFTWLRRTSL